MPSFPCLYLPRNLAYSVQELLILAMSRMHRVSIIHVTHRGLQRQSKKCRVSKYPCGSSASAYTGLLPMMRFIVTDGSSNLASRFRMGHQSCV